MSTLDPWYQLEQWEAVQDFQLFRFVAHPEDRDAFRTDRVAKWVACRPLWSSRWWPKPPAAVHRVLPTGREVLE